MVGGVWKLDPIAWSYVCYGSGYTVLDYLNFTNITNSN